MPQEFVEILKSYGLAGLVIFALGWIAITLYRDNKALNKELNATNAASIRANEQMTNALNQMAEVNRATQSTIQGLSQQVQQLAWRLGWPKQGQE